MTFPPHVLKFLLYTVMTQFLKFGIDASFLSGVIFISKSDGLSEIQ
jgi:hypothetical protein